MKAPEAIDRTPDEIRRCHLEIAAIEAELAAGNPDTRGLNLGWLDWHMEILMILRERRHG